MEAISLGRLRSLQHKCVEKYQGALPFPYLVVDKFLGDELAVRLEKDFPGPTDVIWMEHSRLGYETKLQLSDSTLFPDSILQVIEEFNGSKFVEFLSEVTGISGLSADSDLLGAGLHQILPDGYLGIHTDFNRHARYRWTRRVNVLLYLNSNWRDEYAGHLELWDSPQGTQKITIAPILDRLVIFESSARSFHGHPRPLKCPADRTRKSIALYYYTKEPPGSDERARGTVWVSRRNGALIECAPQLFTDAAEAIIPQENFDSVAMSGPQQLKKSCVPMPKTLEPREPFE